MHLNQLSQLASLLGSDPKIVQAAGGNISLKIGNDLWIKASGKWLASAWQENIFVKAPLDKLKQMILDGNHDLSEVTAADGLRPSLETTMHAALEAPIVVHTHPLSVLSYAVRAHGKEQLAKLLGDIEWSWVPYAKPGKELCEAIIKHAGPNAKIIILQNHGLIIAANNCDEAFSLHQQIINRLPVEQPFISPPNIELKKIIEKSNELTISQEPFLHALAMNAKILELFQAGILYPDQAVMLGVTPYIFSWEQVEQNVPNTPYLIIPHMGVLLNSKISKTTLAMLEFHSLLLLTLANEKTLNYLTQQDIASLLNWDAEKYRQSLAK